MIVVNGKEYRTLTDELLVNGRKVYKVYANGGLVYPDQYDPRYTYVVATGEWEGDLADTDPSDDYSAAISTSVSAKVTWVVKFVGDVFSVNSEPGNCWLSVGLYNPENLKDYELKRLIDCWTTIELSVGEASEQKYEWHTEYTDHYIRDTHLDLSQGVASMVSGTYEFKRYIDIYRIFTALNYGDVGVSGEFGYDMPPQEETYIPIDTFPVLRFSLGTSRSSNPINERPDVSLSFGPTNDYGFGISFGSIGITVSNLFLTQLKEVRIASYTDQDGNSQPGGWIDTRNDFETRVDRFGRIVYSNDGTVVHRLNLSDKYAKPYYTVLNRKVDVRADEVNVFLAGEALPAGVVEVCSAGFYDERIFEGSRPRSELGGN